MYPAPELGRTPQGQRGWGHAEESPGQPHQLVLGEDAKPLRAASMYFSLNAATALVGGDLKVG